jgi:hypothetical protein
LTLKIFASANIRLHPTTGILPVKLGYRHLEVGSDPQSDLVPPVAGETGRWASTQTYFMKSMLSSMSNLLTGAFIGGDIGLRLSIIYAIAGSLSLLSMAVFDFDFGSYALFGIMAAIPLGVVPSILIGIGTGSILWSGFRVLAQFLSTRTAIFMGFGITSVIAITLNLFFFPTTRDLHLYWIGIPSLIYVGAGGWAGYSIYRKLFSTNPTKPKLSTRWVLCVTLIVAGLEQLAFALVFVIYPFLYLPAALSLIVAIILGYIELRRSTLHSSQQFTGQ